MNRQSILFAFLFALACTIPLACETTSDDDSSSSGSDDSGTVADAEDGNSDTHEDASDCTWDSSDVTSIVLDGDTITVGGVGANATVSGSTVTITAAGTYDLSGELDDGQIIVNAGEDSLVRLLLDGATIRSSSSAPIYVVDSDKTVIVTVAGTTNRLEDGSSYTASNLGVDEPTAAVFSMSDLTICGSGSLTVEGNYKDGITSKDGLIISGGTIAVSATDDGIRGKDYLVLEGGDITVDAGGDGLKADNEDDTTKGYISVTSGTIDVSAEGDAIVAQTDVLISGGNIDLTSGGGSSASISQNASAKGIKAGVNLIVDGGTISANSADDALHSSSNVTINDGSLTIASGDDGIHADVTLTVNGGDIDITKAYEGLESSSVMTINAGDIHVVSSDDGVNVAGGGDGSGWDPAPGGGGMDEAGDYYLYINGGRLVVNAVGDGIDVNGYVEMTDGVVIVNGPTSDANGPLDHASFKISGGLLLAVGSSGMALAPSTTSTQRSVKITYSSWKAAGNLVRIQKNGSDVMTFAPAKAYRSVVFSDSTLTSGSSYNLYSGGSCTGTATDGLYDGGTYTPGTNLGSFSIQNIVTNLTAQ
jgi:hypothetical protein